MAEGLEQRLKDYVTSGAYSTGGIDDAFIASCVAEASALVLNRIGSAGVEDADAEPPVEGAVPNAIYESAVISVGAELYNRRSAPSGISQFTSADGSPIRLARDPMTAAETVLRPFLPGGFA